MRVSTAQFIEKTTAFICKTQKCNVINVGYVESIWELENGDLEWVASLCKDEEKNICYEAYYNYSTQEFILQEYKFNNEMSKRFRFTPEDGVVCDTDCRCGIDSYSDNYHYDTYTGTIYETYEDGSVSVYYQFRGVAYYIEDICDKSEEEIMSLFEFK